MINIIVSSKYHTFRSSVKSNKAYSLNRSLTLAHEWQVHGESFGIGVAKEDVVNLHSKDMYDWTVEWPFRTQRGCTRSPVEVAPHTCPLLKTNKTPFQVHWSLSTCRLIDSLLVRDNLARTAQNPQKNKKK